MSDFSELKRRVMALSSDELVQLRQWLLEFDQARRDANKESEAAMKKPCDSPGDKAAE
jgi:hypothetical protein